MENKKIFITSINPNDAAQLEEKLNSLTELHAQDPNFELILIELIRKIDELDERIDKVWEFLLSMDIPK